MTDPIADMLARLRNANSAYHQFGICRICFREMAHRGELPGITKASW
jgi:small subunit ribosomal protein S14